MGPSKAAIAAHCKQVAGGAGLRERAVVAGEAAKGDGSAPKGGGARWAKAKKRPKATKPQPW